MADAGPAGNQDASGVGRLHHPQSLPRLRRKWDTEGEESCARRANSCTDDSGCFPHLFPDPNCRSIHKKQSYLLTAFSAETVDADCRQEAPLPRLEQVRFHADSRRIFSVPYFLRVLRNYLIVQCCRRVLRDQTLQEIIRRGTRVMERNAHSATRRENQ
jgi:hypothetical protein